jgi:membrane peptidoglycan carboxypeptidase
VRAMDAGAAACEVDILRGVVTGGTGTRANFSGHTPVGKTGTTDNRWDASFLGMVPQLAAFVWHGSTEGNVPGAGFGGEIPATIWNRFMSAAMAGQPRVEWPEPGSMCGGQGRFVDPFKGRTGSPVGQVTEDTTPLPPPEATTTLPPVSSTPPELTVPPLPTAPPSSAPPTTVAPPPPP